jgi:hypothetical protein
MIVMDKEESALADDEATRDADLARREKALTDELDALQDQVKPKKPRPPPIGAMF